MLTRKNDSFQINSAYLLTTTMTTMISKNINYLSLLILPMLFSCGSDDDSSAQGAGDNSYVASISSGTIEVNENGNGTPLTVNIDQVNTEGANLSINYTLSGSATNGEDFENLSGNVSIPEGATEATIPFDPINDQDVEGDETATISLSASSNVELGSQSSVTITILDDDEGVAVTCDYTVYTDRDECDNPGGTLDYSESVDNGMRTVTGSGIPNHDYGNQFQDFPDSDPNSDIEVTDQNHRFVFPTNPRLASSATGILDNNNRPSIEYGIALNGVPIDPAPAEPFIFENTETGEFNWDWVFEPNNNKEAVGLDCAVAHVQPDGAYHYHGDMAPLADIESSGVSCGEVTTSPVQVGWAADGYPIVYRYGPSADGSNIVLLEPSYSLKSGTRPGDGVSAPNGTYDGQYTNDYEFDGSGDLDECNGIERSITLTTKAGTTETFNYFYVITEDFPIIGRCLSGTPDDDFSKF